MTASDSTGIAIQATAPQAEFYQNTGKYPAFVGGFGSGKSQTLCNQAIFDIMAGGSGSLVACYEPSYDLIKMILVPRFDELFSDFGIRYTHHKMDNIIFTSNPGVGDIVLRSTSNPDRIIGYESYRSHVDELDTLPQEKAENVWNKIIARNRQRPNFCKRPSNRVSVYTTPEGFRFVYHRWVKNNPNPDLYQLVKARTLSNPWLPDDYVQSLIDSYPPQLVDAYINGEFVNMTAGRVYIFDREAHNSHVVRKPREKVRVGMDFNVMNMSAVVFVDREGISYAVDEVSEANDTPDMVRILKERYSDGSIEIYPDASSKNTTSKNASQSDLTILRQAGFHVRIMPSNPTIKDRVIAVNSALHRGVVKINLERCPELVSALEQQVYTKNGVPEKNPNDSVDDMCDAFGYYVSPVHPVIRRSVAAERLRGF